MTSIGLDAAAWWMALTPDATEAQVSTPRIARRCAREALAARLQEGVRRAVLRHSAAARIFTTLPGGTPADRRAVDASEALETIDLALWADASCHLDPSDPLRCVTAAHARVLQGRLVDARALLVHALIRFPRHPRRFVLWQNLGVVRSLSGHPLEALEAYREAMHAPRVADRLLAACAVCVVATKLRLADAVKLGATALAALPVEQPAEALRATIEARARRGPEPFWSFTPDDVAFLRAHAGVFAVPDSWCIETCVRCS